MKLISTIVTLLLASNSYANGTNNDPIESSEILTVQTVTCKSSSLSGDYFVNIGDQIKKKTLVAAAKSQFSKGEPVQLTFDSINEIWTYSSKHSSTFKDDFPCSDLEDTLVITFK